MILLLISLKLAVCVAVTHPTCVAPACAVGEPTRVTCYFHKDIIATKDEIVVKHYPAGSRKTGTIVLMCYWLLDSGKLKCTAQDGYHFNGSISDRLTLLIPSATKDSEGQYACNIVHPVYTEEHTCELTVQDRSEHPSSTDSTPANDCNAGCHTPTGNWKTILIITVSLLLVASILLNGCLLYRGQYLKRFCGAVITERCTTEDRRSCRAVFTNRRTSEDQDPECAVSMLSPDAQPTNTREASSQTEDDDSYYEPVIALQTLDSPPRLTPKSSTTGNVLEKPGLIKRVVKKEL